MVGFQRTATREMLGTASLRNSSHLLRQSRKIPGWPGQTGYKIRSQGIARNEHDWDRGSLVLRRERLTARMTLTFRLSSSPMSSGNLSLWPSAHRSTKATFFPSTYPCSRIPSRKASKSCWFVDADCGPRKPMVGAFRGLLRACGKRPSRCRAAEKRDELAPLHLTDFASIAAGQAVTA